MKPDYSQISKIENPEIIFLNHASFIIKMNDIKIIIDPYLYGSAFNNGWNLLKEIDHTNEIKDITHIFYTHEHPDHFSIPFLKKIEPDIRKNITILYQETYDKRVKIFCESMGFKFKEIKDGVEQKIDNQLNVLIGKVPFFDSWINFKINEFNILNVNDCVLENPKLVFDIKKKLNRKIDVLFTQFSYANFIEKGNQKNVALQQLENIKQQDKILCPSYLIPFASFIYFSHKENKFMNKNINSIREAYDFIKINCKAKPVILKPNECWNFKEKQNEVSLQFWDNLYKNIENFNYHSVIKKFDINEIIKESKEYVKRIKKKNNRFLIYLLHYLNFFPSITIYVSDIDKYLEFNILKGLKIFSNKIISKKFISLSSESLIFVLKYEFGLDTLLVNARLKCDENYLKTVTKCLFIASLNNTGRYIGFTHFSRYLNVNFLYRGLEKLYLKKNLML